MLLKLAALKCCVGKLVKVDLGKGKEKDIYNKIKIGLWKDYDVERFFFDFRMLWEAELARTT